MKALAGEVQRLDNRIGLSEAQLAKYRLHHTVFPSDKGGGWVAEQERRIADLKRERGRTITELRTRLDEIDQESRSVPD